MESEIIRGYEVSAQQRRVWLLQQEESKAYCAQCAILIEGRLDKAALEEALKEVIERHESLRTTFGRRPGMRVPLQVIKEGRVEVWGRDEEVEEGEVEEEVERVMKEEREAGFDYERGPMVRSRLMEMSERRNVLVVSVPALCADGRSMTNLVADLSRCYEASLRGTSFPDQPTRYIQFSEWQNELLRNEEEEEGRAYWRKQETDCNRGGVRLPFEGEAVEGMKFRPAQMDVEISAASAERLARVSESTGSGLEAALLASWGVLLWRLSGEANVVVGELYGGRKYAELEAAVGLYGRYVPVRMEMSGGMRFRELLEQVDESRRLAAEWQEYFAQGDDDDTSAAGAGFAVGFEYVKEPEPSQGADVRFSLYEQYSCIDQFKVKLSCLRRQESVRVELHYDSSIYEAADIRRMAEQLERVVESASREPGRYVRELEMVGAREYEQLTVEFNGKSEKYEGMKCIHEMIEEQAARNAEECAVIYEQERMSYGEMNGKANQLARHLQAMGVGPEVPVGLLLERSVDMIVAIMGILKAGGAY